MLERSVDVSYQAIRRQTVKFSPLIAQALRRQPRPGDIRHRKHNELSLDDYNVRSPHSLVS
ncbi:hypothetical protein DSM110093_03903 (plasmid) [Sulfitobacter sp. DSM 110093]|nr:hypothetical protein DSM110093_03903 [Sulfitobacter sp. DSM 110093]